MTFGPELIPETIEIIVTPGEVPGYTCEVQEITDYENILIICTERKLFFLKSA